MDSRTDAEVIACSVESPASFGELFDRHGTTLFRYFVRRVGPDDADSLLGELFRIAFERRESYDTARAEARPWLYGIASNLLARHRQGEARRLDAIARLVNTSITASDLFSEVDARLDASRRWTDVAAAITTLPQGERDTLLLFSSTSPACFSSPSVAKRGWAVAMTKRGCSPGSSSATGWS
jgi:DNA-directed RNA polymerase specialized sigma24 family protein